MPPCMCVRKRVRMCTCAHARACACGATWVHARACVRRRVRACVSRLQQPRELRVSIRNVRRPATHEQLRLRHVEHASRPTTITHACRDFKMWKVPKIRNAKAIHICSSKLVEDVQNF
eukprot:5462814-Pleurochrysis_carterae.AAC.2